MSTKLKYGVYDENASGSDLIALMAIDPVFAPVIATTTAFSEAASEAASSDISFVTEAAAVYESSVAASNTYRSSQWHLDGYLTNGGNAYGANVDAISTEYTGAGVRVGIIDQGFDITNVDLVGRFDMDGSFDPRDTAGNTNIAPDSSSEGHGTWVAGVIGASASNGVGVVGVAYDATLVGFYGRFGFGGSSVSELTDLLARQVNVDVSNNSWGYSTAFTDNFRKDGWNLVRDAMANAAEHGRDALGTVYVFAAGNDRQYIQGTGVDGDNTNNHSLTNSRYVITTAASTEDGHIATFSTPGASILVTAPGKSILTTAVNNHDGNPDNDVTTIGGTSLAAPIVTGVVALMLEANPDLGYRDVQEILALSSQKIDPAAASWTSNGATNWNGGGNMVSHDFGFGLVDAHAAVRLAETWTLQSTAANEQVISVAGNVASGTLLSQSGPNQYVTTVSADYATFSIDWVELDITLQNARNGDLTIELISPNGTDSVLLDRPNNGTNGNGNLNFTFSTTHNWGETPNGNWTVVIHDAGSNGTDAIVSYSLRIYGDDQGTANTYFYTNDFATLSGSRNDITDTQGNDAINAAAVTTNLILDLNAGHTSTIAGQTVTISAGTVIEHAYAGDGDDLIIGNDANNYLYGGHGHNNLRGGAGDDTLIGGRDGSQLAGGIGNDIYEVRSVGDIVAENSGEGTDVAHVYINNYTLTANVENGVAELTTGQTLTGNGAANWMLGNSGGDTLIGGLGDDSLNGGAGRDTLIGGLGNDQYVIDSVSDIVIEDAGGGTDAVYVLADGYVLTANVETGVIGINTGATLTGNGGSNTLFGGSGNDILIGGGGDDYLSGRAGTDRMIGGTGNDTYLVDNLGDVIVEQAGEGSDYAYVSVSGYTASENVEVVVVMGTVGETVTGRDGDSVLWGSSGADTLTGQSGNDIIFGGAGADTMTGAGGSDLYFVDNLADHTVENVGEGTDSVYVVVSGYTLGDNVEVGVIESATGITLSGSAGDNYIWGNIGGDTIIGGGGNDFLSGNGGVDTLIGGTGNDVYVVDNQGDVIIEAANEGTDTVFSLANDYTLAANVEVGAILATDGATLRANDQGVTLWGGQGNDALIGGAGSDVLNGSTGHDILTGGGASDSFVFQFSETQGDTITDFSNAEGDQLYFSGFGTAEQGAHFTQIDATHWAISSADGLVSEQITFQNGATINANDWHFI